jgi:hypothetical protein
MSIPAFAVRATPERSGWRPDQPAARVAHRGDGRLRQSEALALHLPTLPIGESDPLIPAPPSLANGEIQIKLPLKDLDVRQVHVFAGPTSLLVESKQRERLPVHSQTGDFVSGETLEKRIAYKLDLRTRIARGGTSIEIAGRMLLITCRKASDSESDEWSEWINFNTRGSMGRAG